MIKDIISKTRLIILVCISLYLMCSCIDVIITSIEIVKNTNSSNNTVFVLSFILVMTGLILLFTWIIFDKIICLFSNNNQSS